MIRMNFNIRVSDKQKYIELLKKELESEFYRIFDIMDSSYSKYNPFNNVFNSQNEKCLIETTKDGFNIVNNEVILLRVMAILGLSPYINKIIVKYELEGEILKLRIKMTFGMYIFKYFMITSMFLIQPLMENDKIGALGLVIEISVIFAILFFYILRKTKAIFRNTLEETIHVYRRTYER